MIFLKTQIYLFFWILFFTAMLYGQDEVLPLFVRDSLRVLPELNDVYGVAFKDLDGDQAPDLYLVRFRNLNRAFLNRHWGRQFRDRTITSRLGGNLFPGHEKNLELGVSVIDLNNDGREDITILGWDEAFAILQQLPGRLFKEIPFSNHLDTMDINHGIWSDIDHNRTLDLFVTNEHGSNRLFLHDGYFQFTDGTKAFDLPEQVRVSQGALFADLNQDGYDDLLVCNWFAPDEIYLNQQGQFFTRVDALIPHLQNPWNSNSISVVDADNDGDPDLIFCDRSGHSTLYLNETTTGDSVLSFRPAPDSIGLHNPYPCYGALVADFDNNGWPDVFFTNIGPNLLFLNMEGTFLLAWEDNPDPNNPIYSTGAATADVDLDGDLDLFVANKDTISFLYINTGNKNHFLRIRLQGIESNHDAVGTRIFLYCQISRDTLLLRGYQQLTSSQGYLSVSENIVHFGTTDEGPYAVKAIFPSGKIRWLYDLKVDRTYFLPEEEGIPASIKYGWILLQAKFHQRGFVLNSILFILLILVFLFFFRFSSKRYQWNTSLIIFYSSLIFFFLYGIFFVFRKLEFLEIMKIQWGFLLTFFSILVLFHERIRKQESARRKTRQALQKFSDDVLFIRDNDQLIQTLLQTLFEQFPLKWIAYFEYKNGQATVKWVKPENQDHYVKTFSVKDTQLLFSDRIHFQKEINQMLGQILGFEPDIIMTLSLKEQQFGFIVFHFTRFHFRREDIHTLEILGNQASIAYSYNEYTKKIQELTTRMVENQLREKYIRELETKNDELQKLYKELQETQAQAIQNEKMISLGQLVSGIAHELNNPISFVYGNLRELENIIRFINQIFEKNGHLFINDEQMFNEIRYIRDELPQMIQESLEGSQRVKEIVETLRQFSREEKGKMGQVDIVKGIESSLLMLKNEWKNKIRIHKSYSVRPIVEGNQNELNQVFLNLLHNAILAIPDEGDIWIAVEEGSDQTIRIQIRDNGEGIPEEIRSRIFDPFFTTRPVGKGTGLGLSISYTIIQKHQGMIEVESQPGEGTTFIIILPVQQNREQK